MHQIPWDTVIMPMDICDPIEIMKKVKRRRVKRQGAITSFDTPNSQAQVRLLDRYNVETWQFVVTTLYPLA